MVPTEKVLDAAVALKGSFVFQRQSSVMIPSFLSLLPYLAALSLCIERARYLKAPQDEQMPLKLEMIMLHF